MRFLVFALVLVAGLAHSNFDSPHVHEDPADADVEEDDEGNILCRFCGQTIATKDDWIARKSAKAIRTGTDEDLGPRRELQRFRNPENTEYDVATFKSVQPGSVQEEAESHKSHSFFPPHEWKAVRCSRCHSFLGWKFGELPKPKPVELEDETADDSTAGVLISEDEQAQAIQHLNGLCLTLPNGWWSYEWCHKKEVRQYHQDGTPASQNWSLGKYDADGRKQRATSVVIRRNQKRRPFISQFFIGGQRCDENSKKRSTEVQFHCCDEHRPSRSARKRKDDPKAVLQSIKEVSLCAYQLVVCVPKLCDVLLPSAAATDKAAIDAMGVRDLKAFLSERGVSMLGVTEKAELVALARAAVAHTAKAADESESDAIFYGLSWDALVAEGSQQLKFARTLSFFTSINR